MTKSTAEIVLSRAQSWLRSTSMEELCVSMADKIQVNVPKDLEDLLPKFLANRKLDIAKLGDALSVGDCDRLSKIGHDLAGICGGYGFNVVGEVGRQIETAAKSKNLRQIAGLISQIDSLLNNVDIRFVEE